MLEKSFGVLLLIANPYLYALLKQGLYNHRGYASTGSEVILPLVVFFSACYLLGAFDNWERGSRHEK